VAYKFGRNYSLFVQEKEQTFVTSNNRINSQIITPFTPGFLQFELPLTMEFDINRDILSACNTSDIRMYNLAKNTRETIYHLQNQGGFFRQVQLQAGYRDTNNPMIFNGNCREAWSVREGNNWVTTISSFDGGYGVQNSDINSVFAANSTDRDRIIQLLNQIAGVSVGYVGQYPNINYTQDSVSGNVAQILRSQFTGFYIDNGIAYCLNDNECIPGSIPEISSRTGLLNTPRIENQLYVIVDMIFEPGIYMSELVQLKSKDFRGIRPTQNNNIYKVIGIHHKGMISGAVCGDATTTLKLQGGITFNTVNS
jgi:hypothetical protein